MTRRVGQQSMRSFILTRSTPDEFLQWYSLDWQSRFIFTMTLTHRMRFEREIRKNYLGPLALAQDLMVFNITRDNIVTRMASAGSHVYPNTIYQEAYRNAPRKPRPEMSQWLSDRRLFRDS